MKDSKEYRVGGRQEIGVIRSVGHGITRVTGLPGVQSEEVILFPGGIKGMAFNLDEDGVGVILLSKSEALKAGHEARRTGRCRTSP